MGNNLVPNEIVEWLQGLLLQVDGVKIAGPVRSRTEARVINGAISFSSPAAAMACFLLSMQ